MQTPDPYRQCERDLVNAAGYCCGCTRQLDPSETYICERCEKEMAMYHDPNGLMKEDCDE